MHEALIVGLIVALIVVTERILAAPLIIRPIVTCPLVGLALGDFQTGLLAGATLEVTFMGAVQIGASLPADATVGGAIGVALAVMSGRGLESVMVIALPVAVAASTLKLIMFTVRSYYMPLAEKYAREANVKGLIMVDIVGGLGLQFIIYFLVTFGAIYAGAPAVEAFLDSIPDVVMHGLDVAAGILPAVGFAYLLLPMLKKDTFLYFLLGFILVSYMGLGTVPITIIACVIAFIITFELQRNGGAQKAKADDDEEGLFDE